MRSIQYNQIVQTLSKACIDANILASEDLLCAYQNAIKHDTQDIATEVLQDLFLNAEIAKKNNMPICQDTGSAVVFLELGQDIQIEGGYLMDAINEGVRKGYREGYLRKSIVSDPLKRINTGDNTPAIVHTEIVPGDTFQITVAPKGGGSENMSRLKMLTPSDGWEGFKDFLLTTVKEAGPNPCPPIIVGACLGGNFESCALEAKRTLLRPIGERHSDPEIASYEMELLAEVNKLNIGPQGFGGDTTAFDVHLSFLPCHIACMPAAVNLNCHVARHISFTL
ncbi:fumarate hydratase [Clostridia bacterium]|nr:fumarate hydratase [Clostridia bacterium]